MLVIKHPERGLEWESALERNPFEQEDIRAAVNEIVSAVYSEGDAALHAFAEKFDKVTLDEFLVSEEEIQEAVTLVADDLKKAIQTAYSNIQKFHQSQLVIEETVETMPGVKCWRKPIAIEKVGLYVPGGSAPLFSTVLMLGIPAQLAGCKQIVLCTPPDPIGKIHPAILFAAQLCGITGIYKVGGAQAIAAMAYGTESVPAVYKIFGPGNQYVTRAKQTVMAFGGTAIDMPAGPSEVLVIGDRSCNASFVAADLLAQAEHGPDSQVIFVTDNEEKLSEVEQAVQEQLQDLPRKDITERALEYSKLVLVKDMDEAIEFSNEYAPEHLILQTQNANELAEKVINAGSVFIGSYTPESAGDYASGTNHTLPTYGYATAYSGVSVDSFIKKITFQSITENGLQNIGPAIEIMAENEGLMAHKNAVSIRLKK